MRISNATVADALKRAAADRFMSTMRFSYDALVQVLKANKYL